MTVLGSCALAPRAELCGLCPYSNKSYCISSAVNRPPNLTDNEDGDDDKDEDYDDDDDDDGDDSDDDMTQTTVTTKTILTTMTNICCCS